MLCGTAWLTKLQLDDIPGKFPLLAYTMYGFYFIFVYTTCTNAMRFAAQLFLIYYQKITLKDLDHENINSNLLRFFAVVITTAVCVLLYVSNSKSRLLNKATALAKIITLLVIAIFGGVYIAKYGASTDEWIHSCPPYSDEHPSDYLWNKDITGSWTTAFILVSYSFHGWENATLVSLNTRP